MPAKRSTAALPKPLSEYDFRRKHPFQDVEIPLVPTLLSLGGKIPVHGRGASYSYKKVMITGDHCREMVAITWLARTVGHNPYACSESDIVKAAADGYPRLGLEYFSAMRAQFVFFASKGASGGTPSPARLGRRLQIALDALVGLPLTLLDPARTEEHKEALRAVVEANVRERRPGVFPFELKMSKGPSQLPTHRYRRFDLTYKALGLDCSLSIPCISLALGLLRQAIQIVLADLDLRLSEVTTPAEVRDTILAGSYNHQLRLIRRLRPWLNLPARKRPAGYYPIVWQPASVRKTNYWQIFQQYARYIHRFGGHVASGSAVDPYSVGYNGFRSFVGRRKKMLSRKQPPVSGIAR